LAPVLLSAIANQSILDDLLVGATTFDNNHQVRGGGQYGIVE
jgi:hypothetical protein